MRIVSTSLLKKFFLFSGTAPETHRLEVVFFGNEEELREILSGLHLKCVGEIKVPKEKTLPYNP